MRKWKKEKYKNRPELSWNLDFDTIEGEALTSCLQNQLKAIFIEIWYIKLYHYWKNIFKKNIESTWHKFLLWYNYNIT